MPRPIPHQRQETAYTCGPAAMGIALHALGGRRLPEAPVARRLEADPCIGTTQRRIKRLARGLGLVRQERHGDTRLDELRHAVEAGRAVLVCYWLTQEDTDHYAVVEAVTDEHVVLSDPWKGPGTVYTRAEFEARWRCDEGMPGGRDRWFLALGRQGGSVTVPSSFRAQNGFHATSHRWPSGSAK